MVEVAPGGGSDQPEPDPQAQGVLFVVEGQARPRSVVIEFPSLEAAQACYDSPGYQAAKALREPVSAADVIIVEGWPG